MKEIKSVTFALFFGNRGFFPGEVIAEAREELKLALRQGGYDYICPDEEATRYGAVETRREGRFYAEFLEQNRGNFDGIILCMPNFSDETGAAEALKDAGVPILVQAYPDEPGKMDFSHRRDAVCGKLAMCQVLRQLGIPYTLTEKMAVLPLEESFSRDLKRFSAICRIVKGMKHFNLGAIGARTTAFKTVRTDEIALQGKGINVETIDLSFVFAMMDNADEAQLQEKKEHYKKTFSFGNWGEEKLTNLARLGVALDRLIEEYSLQAVAVRCWDEFITRYKIAPCLVLSDLNERGIPAACELDINNAVAMYALYLASEEPVTLLDVNNNYGTETNKCIMFHCSAVPVSLFKEAPVVGEHLMFKKTYGAGSGVGCLQGNIKAGDFTVLGAKTESGKACAFTTNGRFTEDTFDADFFGAGVVFEHQDMESVFRYMCENGYKHHVAVGRGDWTDSIEEALRKYLGYDIWSL